MPYRDVPWVYDLRIPGLTSERQDEVVAELRKEGIAARHGFKPMSSQVEYCGVARRVRGENAERLSREVLYLPIVPGKTARDEIAHSFEVIKRVVAG